MSKIYNSLTLYHFESCPFCQKVRRFMEENKMNILQKDIHKEDLARKELLEIGGKPQVPCLVIDGVALYESNDIIDWLKLNWKPES